MANTASLDSVLRLGRRVRPGRGQGHPFLRRNEPFLCLIPDYRPPRGIGIGIGVRTQDGSWEIEYGETLTYGQLKKFYPKVRFFTWDTVINNLWRKHV